METGTISNILIGKNDTDDRNICSVTVFKRQLPYISENKSDNLSSLNIARMHTASMTRFFHTFLRYFLPWDSSLKIYLWTDSTS